MRQLDELTILEMLACMAAIGEEVIAGVNHEDRESMELIVQGIYGVIAREAMMCAGQSSSERMEREARIAKLEASQAARE